MRIRGDWSAIALIASSCADPDDPKSLRYRGEPSGPTPVLAQCPYFQEVIAYFKTQVHRARLMNLKPGTVITPHRDYGQQRYSIERGFIRVHIPVRSHKEVYFFIGGKRIPMQPGEAWYTNVCHLHAVRNDSDVQRVHLVLDMQVNEWVRQFFPPQTLLDKAWGALLHRYEHRVTEARFAALRGWTALKKRLGDTGLRALKKRLLG